MPFLMEAFIHMHVSSPRLIRYFQMLKKINLCNAGILTAMLCLAVGIACGQSSIPSLPSVATITFNIAPNNCAFNDPNLGWVLNSGTISITINNSEIESAIYQCNTGGTAYDYIQNLANNINKNSPWVIAAPVSDLSSGINGGSLRLISKAHGTSTQYPLSVSTTWASDFSGPAYIPSTPATMNTFGSRNFAISTFGDTNVGPADEDVAFMLAGSDLTTRGGNDLQPSGLSIMDLKPLSGQYNLPQADFQGNIYDYSRIAAVLVDEPFNLATSTPWTNPCHDSRYSQIQQISQQLQALAQAIRQKSPKTRFWVNYSEPEVQWMRDTTCPAANPMGILNGSYIDVVSMDKYEMPFAGTTSCLVFQQPAGCVQPYYDWLIANRAYPGQQIALVPGIFANNSTAGNVETQASRLQGFFDYATSQNQACNTPLGNTGITGHADGCLVWMMIGFAPHQNSNGIGEDDPGAEPIQQVWRAEVSLPLTIALTRPSSLATVAPGTTAFTHYITPGGQVWTSWCATSGCTWDDPSGNSGAPTAVTGSSLSYVWTSSGDLVHFLTPDGHVHSIMGNFTLDETHTANTVAAVTGSTLATLVSPSGTPSTYFLTPGGAVWTVWCTSQTSCTWDDPSGDANAPAAASGSPLSVVWTNNGPVAYFLTPNGHVISLTTGNGLSDTWTDITAAAGSAGASPGSPLVTIVSPNGMPTSYFFAFNGQVWSNWCTASGCTWDDPSGDAKAPAAAIGSPLTGVWTNSGPLVHFLIPNGHVISLTTGNGFSDVWKDETTAAGAPAAAIESPLTTVVLTNGTVVSHFITPGGHVNAISCTTSGCTWTDETAAAGTVAAGFF
jgi:hypothetical protein